MYFKNVIIFPSESMKRVRVYYRVATISQSKQRNASAASQQPYAFYTIVKILMIVTISFLLLQQKCPPKKNFTNCKTHEIKKHRN